MNDPYENCVNMVKPRCTNPLGAALSKMVACNATSDDITGGTDRVCVGQPRTLGDLRRMTASFADDLPLAVRNGPLPTLYYLRYYGGDYLELATEAT